MAEQRRFDVLLTAQEAYPAFERLWLDAKTSVNAGFRIFDPMTRLRSDAGMATGSTWFDLIVDTLNRGVRVQIRISDFDPVARTNTHRYSWRCVRAVIAAGEVSNNPHLLQARVIMHPARLGILPRLALWPVAWKRVRDNLKDINAQDPARQSAFLRDVPGLAPYLRQTGNGLYPRVFPPMALVPASQHQKVAVFDDKTLYVGGLDLNDRRYDTPQHRQSGEQTWHDVQIITDGPAAKEAEQHLDSFDDMTHGRKPPGRPVHLLRTMSKKRNFAVPYLSPKPLVQELAEAHHERVRKAKKLIYLETQFFRDLPLARALAEAATCNRDLSLILILPAAPEDIAFGEPGSDAAYGEHLQIKAVDKVREAFGERVFIGSPAQPRSTRETGRRAHFGAPLIYLHAKVSIFDSTAAIVSSANLNGRSMAWDTEVGISTTSSSEVGKLQRRCFDHWLGGGAGPAHYDLSCATSAWAALARENAASAPEKRRGFLLPYDPDAPLEIAQNLPVVPEEMV
jgi:phosphatidylserine/phosphatidylglycerophosphate/cardiolipin synthase-like enzyme